MVAIPTVEELKRKAEECRADAEEVQHPDFRANMLQIAAEYERLVKRAAEYEERQRVGANTVVTEQLIKNWFERRDKSAPISGGSWGRLRDRGLLGPGGDTGTR